MEHELPDGASGRMNTITVHYKVRPRKTAFLINPELGMEPILSAIEYCQREWGGRFNLLVPTDGSVIADAWFKLLKLFDPDEIFAVPDIDDKLKNVLERSLTFTKYDSVELGDNGECRSIKAHDHFFDIDNVIPMYESRRSVILREPPDRIFRLSSSQRAAPFYVANFGVFDRIVSTLEMFENIQDHLDIDLDKESDVNIFGFFNKKEFNPVTLNELASYKAYSELFEGCDMHNNECFQIIIGDNPLNMIYLWDRIFLLGRQEWKPQLSRYQIWLPNNVVDDLLTDAEKLDAFIGMGKILSRSYNQMQMIKFISYDAVNVKNEELKKKVEEGISKKTGLHVHSTNINYFNPDQFPDIKAESGISRDRTPVTCILTEKKNDTPVYTFEMPKPDILQRFDLADRRFFRVSWAVDIQIEKYAPHIINTNEKYRFPFRRDSSCAFHPARVSKYGDIVVDAVASKKQGLLKIPPNSTLFFHLLTGFYHTVYKHEENLIRQNIFKTITTSDKGKYQRGFIGLFGSLDSAANYCESPFWRELLEYMSGKIFCFGKEPTTNTDKLLGEIKRNICGNIYIRNGEDYEQIKEEEYRDLAIRLDEKITGLRGHQKEVTLKEILKYREGFEREKLRDDIFNSDFRYLVESNILLQGFRPQCKRCGSRLWYPIEEVKKQIACTGCESVFHMPPEEEWSYRLNTLCANAIREHGVIPVILSLRHLKHFDWKSFEYYPSQELIPSDRRHGKREIDIVCLVNGKLAIGEIKSSERDIKTATLEKCKQLSFEIKPDIFIIYLMKQVHEISKAKKSLLTDFAKELKSNGVRTLALFPPKGIFERDERGSISFSIPKWIVDDR